VSFENSIRVRPIGSQAEFDHLVANAKTDDHVVLFPTHAVWKGGEIVGYGSINATPIVNVWLHSEKIGPRDSVQLLGVAEALATTQGLKQIIMPCAENSPFYPMMDKLGFHRLGFTSLNVKQF
jgi:hypothetical protein